LEKEELYEIVNGWKGREGTGGEGSGLEGWEGGPSSPFLSPEL